MADDDTRVAALDALVVVWQRRERSGDYAPRWNCSGSRRAKARPKGSWEGMPLGRSEEVRRRYCNASARWWGWMVSPHNASHLRPLEPMLPDRPLV